MEWVFSGGCGSGGPSARAGGSVAGPALVRHDEEIEIANSHVRNLGGAPRAIVEFRSGGSAVDVFELALAPSFLRAICSIRSFGIANYP